MKTELYAFVAPEARITNAQPSYRFTCRTFWPIGPLMKLWSTLSATLLAGILLFFLAGPLLRLADPTAAAVDIGALSLLLLGLVSGLGFITVSHWLTGLLWPVFRDFRKHHFEPFFKSLRPWQKILIYLGCFFLLLYAFVACLAAVC